MTARHVKVFVLVLVVIGVMSSVAPRATVAPLSEPAVNFVAVCVDGVDYDRAQFEQQFGEQVLPWVADDTAPPGTLIAFTIEAKRAAAYTITTSTTSTREDTPASEANAATAVNIDATLYDYYSWSGKRYYVYNNVSNLGSFNDRAISVHAHAGIILYEHDQYRGCSLYIQPRKIIDSLARHTTCNITKTWKQRASSVKVVP